MFSEQFHWQLLTSGEKVLVAVSGGPDSLCLLHLLWTERKARQLGSVEAAHLDHGLRSAESAAEAAWVAAWCRERGIVCHIGRVDVAALARERRLSTQEAAREARYEFLLETAENIGADKIATGHTQSDQVETVLANILRGTGLDGLRGIPERRGMIVRPMLDMTRAEVEAYNAEHGLSPRQDASNFFPDHYTRNRIRLELLPELRAHYNSSVDAALLRLSEIASRDGEYLAAQAETALSEGTFINHPQLLVLATPTLNALHPALLRHVLRLALERVRGTRTGIGYEHLEAVCEAVAMPPKRAFSLTLPSPHCRVQVTQDRITLTAIVPAAKSAPAAMLALTVPGEAVLDADGWTVRASWEDHPGAVRMDADAVDLDALTVRKWRHGDRIDPLGMGGKHKKVSEIFTDAKVPRFERHRIPIVADSRGILWIAGHTQAERAKVTSNTTKWLFLSARNAAQPANTAGKETGDRE